MDVRIFAKNEGALFLCYSIGYLFLLIVLFEVTKWLYFYLFFCFLWA